MKDIDMLHGSLAKGLILFSLPIAASAILQQLFNSADLAVVGRFVGTAAQAAVGADTPITTLLVNLFVGISLGATVVIAQSIGAGKHENVTQALHTAVLIAIAGGVIIAIAGELLAVPVLRLLSVPADVMDGAALYLKIYLLGMPVILLYNFLSAVFRGRGNTRTPLLCLALSGVINVGLNVIFITAFDMTVDGVAWATVISNLIAAILLLASLARGPELTRLHVSQLRFHGDIFKRIMKIGLPAGIQSASFNIASVCVQSAVNSLGKTVMAASSAAFNIESMCYNVMNSFGQACTTFVGQNYGAGQNERCRKALRTAYIEDYTVSIVLMSLVYLFGRQILRLFNTDPEVIDYGYLRLGIAFIAYLFGVNNDMLAGYMRGFGMSLAPMIVIILSACGIRIVWVFAVFPHYRTLTSLMLSFPVSLAVASVVLIILTLIFRPSRTRRLT